MSIFTNWGATKTEQHLAFTCDKMVKNHNGAYWRAVTIDAPGDDVYQWIKQMRVARYSYDRLDNGGRQSPQHLDSSLGELGVGQNMMNIFHVAHFIPKQEVTMVMDVPPKKMGERICSNRDYLSNNP